MKLLIYSHFFYPSVGGVETVSMELAKGLTDRGFEIEIITTTQEKGKVELPWPIHRNVSFSNQKSLVKSCEVLLYNGCSLQLIFWALVFQKPVVWVHVGYQVSCIDGLGWVEGTRAPLNLWDSFLFHFRKNGPVFALKGGFITCLKRLVAQFIVKRNVAITQWMNEVQPLHRQTVIYNPFEWPAIPPEEPIIEYDFVYVGRLVSEKGVETLLNALKLLVNEFGQNAKLVLIGDGNWKKKLLSVAREGNLEQNVHFVGKKTKEEWPTLALKAKAAIVPSDWYEPMGIVALELLHLGLPVIVSEKGGLKECVGNAGLTFENENVVDLAIKMRQILTNNELYQTLKTNAKIQSQRFLHPNPIDQYQNLLLSLKLK